MSLRSSINWSFIAVLARHILQFGSTLIVARLLVPSDFGLAAMVATVTNFLVYFLDCGLSWVTIQSEKIDDQQISNLFWMNTGMGAMIGAICLMMAPLIADFYNQPTLTPFLYLQGLTLLFFGMSVQPLALMKRNTRFKAIAASEIGSNITGITLTIGMALLGYGVWSLIIPSIINHFCRTIWVMWQSKIKIMKFRADHHLKSHAQVGGQMTIAGLFFYVSRNLDDILIGRVFGINALGFYSRAYTLSNIPVQVPMQTLSTVMVANLSRQREKNEDWYGTYKNVLVGVSSFVSPLAAGLAITSHESIRLLYGEKWMPVATLLFWLALAGIFQPAYSSVGWMLVALAKYKNYFWWSLCSAVLLAAGFFTAMNFDSEAVAISYFISGGLLLSLPSQYFVHKKAHKPFAPLFKDLLKIYFSIAMMALVAIELRNLSGLTMENYILRLALMASSGAAVYVLLMKLLFKKLPVDFKKLLRPG